MPKIKFTFITLFPEALQPYLDSSMMWKAQDKGIVEFAYVNLRDYGLGPHKSVDDTPYGGGDGMLLRCEPVFAAIEAVKSHSPTAKVILPTPAGELWTQELARRFAGVEVNNSEAPVGVGGHSSKNMSQPPVQIDNVHSYESEVTPSARNMPDVVNLNAAGGDRSERNGPDPSRHFIIFCPHYEGYDERILTLVDHPISLGPYILTGGELPALILTDSIVRLLPGVLGGAHSAEIESFSDGDNIEYPQYTKPADFRGLKVPDVLLSGNHGAIDEWRRAHTKHAK